MTQTKGHRYSLGNTWWSSHPRPAGVLPERTCTRCFGQDAGGLMFPLKMVVPWLPFTLPETNIAPKNGWLEYYFPIGEAYFQGLCLVSGRVVRKKILPCSRSVKTIFDTLNFRLVKFILFFRNTISEMRIWMKFLIWTEMCFFFSFFREIWHLLEWFLFPRFWRVSNLEIVWILDTPPHHP